MEYDFCGWATKNNLKCADGVTIRRDAFRVNDGKKVPLVWNHQHNSVGNVLGHAMLENRDEGVYAYCQLNNTSAGKDAKEVIKHGDVVALSVWANNIDKSGDDVIHGVIREVSLVLAGANPGAFVESVISHGEPMGYDEDEGIFYTGEGIIFESDIQHSDQAANSGADISHAENSKSDKKSEEDKKTDTPENDKTIGEVFNTLNEEQKTAVAIIVGQAIADAKENSDNKENKEDDKTMSHNIFDQDGGKNNARVLSHSECNDILENAKQVGSLRKVFRETVGDDVIAHAVPMDGMVGPATSESTKTAGIKGIDMLLPEYRNQNMPPEFISRDMGWVSIVLNGVHKLPYERVKTMFADITEDDARAKGYVKGDQKFPEVFSTLTRTTEGQMIYKLQKLDREDILDITDFDMVPWIKREMDMMLDEEKARAILIGDGRQANDKFKIKEDRIRPIVTDVALFNVRVKVTPPANADLSTLADTTIDAVIRARKKYKGSGNPIFFTTEDVVTEMLMIKDKIGHKLYKTMQELATALRVSNIVTVEPMSGYKIDGEELVGVVVNLNDYAVGQNPRAKRDMFEDFDIDFNKYTYLKEEKFSGALIKPFSALTITLAAGSSFTPSESAGGSSGEDNG